MTESLRGGMSVQFSDVEISVRYDGVKWIADYENAITVELFDGIEQLASVILSGQLSKAITYQMVRFR